MASLNKEHALIKELKRVLDLKEVPLDDNPDILITNKEAIVRTLMQKAIDDANLQAIQLIADLLSK